MKIVFLDAKTLGDDIDYTQFEQLGEVVKYPFTSSEEVPERAAEADVLIVNKVLINGLPCRARDRMAQCCRLLHGIRCAAYLCHALLSDGESALLR